MTPTKTRTESRSERGLKRPGRNTLVGKRDNRQQWTEEEREKDEVPALHGGKRLHQSP